MGFFAREQLKILLWRDGGIAAESVRFVIVRNHQLVTVDNQSTLGVLLLASTCVPYDISDISRLHFITTCVRQVGMTKCEREIWRYQSLHILCLHFVEYIALTLALSAIVSLCWLSALWRWLLAQRCLSALGYQRLVLCAGSQRGAGS